jgi:hypothetical protein
MRQKLISKSSTRLLISFAMIVLTGIGLSAASAQTSSQSQNTRSAAVTTGSGQYYFEFRSRQAWDYGHTFVVFGRVGEPPRKSNVAEVAGSAAGLLQRWCARVSRPRSQCP